MKVQRSWNWNWIAAVRCSDLEGVSSSNVRRRETCSGKSRLPLHSDLLSGQWLPGRFLHSLKLLMFAFSTFSGLMCQHTWFYLFITWLFLYCFHIKGLVEEWILWMLPKQVFGPRCREQLLVVLEKLTWSLNNTWSGNLGGQLVQRAVSLKLAVYLGQLFKWHYLVLLPYQACFADPKNYLNSCFSYINELPGLTLQANSTNAVVKHACPSQAGWESPAVHLELSAAVGSVTEVCDTQRQLQLMPGRQAVCFRALMDVESPDCIGTVNCTT